MQSTEKKKKIQNSLLGVYPLSRGGTYLSIYVPWPFPPVWGVADNTKETKKKKKKKHKRNNKI